MAGWVPLGRSLSYTLTRSIMHTHIQSIACHPSDLAAFPPHPSITHTTPTYLRTDPISQPAMQAHPSYWHRIMRVCHYINTNQPRETGRLTPPHTELTASSEREGSFVWSEWSGWPSGLKI
mmetsp:Transcript_35326/g.101567  ORF Transcript_35326/g.101567 Transcript_35326/m.101567 type:complete len:121 (-) Transcript_35326:107-469(-)